MKTEQEIRQMVNTCNVYRSCALCPYRPKDISRFIGDRWKGGCPNYDRQLVYAMGKGYGDISEYKAEIERLKAENEKLLDSIESVQAGRCRLRCPLTEQAVKEFAERLKKYSYTDNCFKDGKWHRYVLVSDIDELIKEIENDNRRN